MTRDDPFEKLLREERRQRAFPLGLCISALAVTGAALAASALNVQWGAMPPGNDALHEAWPYVNVAVLWAWLLVWPVAALGRRELRRRGLWFDLVVIAIAVLPGMTVAAFLSGASVRSIEVAAAVQVGVGLLTLGILAWHARLPAGLLAGVTATLAVGVPVLGYVWSEFFLNWPQGWMAYLPTEALAVVLSPQGPTGPRPLLLAAIYAVVGAVLVITAPPKRATA